MRHVPITTIALGLTLCGLFAWQVSLDAYHDMNVVLKYGVVPAQLLGFSIALPGIAEVPPIATLVTAQGLHGGFGHLIGNLAALAFAGPPAEAQTGAWRLLLVFLLAGAAGLAVEAVASATSSVPIIGASAAIAGVIGAVTRRDPHGHVRMAIPARGFRLRRIAIPVLPVVAVWLVAQLAGIAFEQGEPVAFLAHATGFIVGVLLAGPDNRRPRLLKL
ncbi:hypothetical protein BAL199_05469 [alpha proteobacterium BAL199]|jgi:membrane associated rhomboid family serine protease|nr:hypothetical protein BAL199_05469 [alpha proteobacterium BAL199]